MFIINNFLLCLENKKKNSVVRGIFLIGGGNLGLDRFYEVDKKGDFFQSLVGVSHFLALYFLNVQFMNLLRVLRLFRLFPQPISRIKFTCRRIW